MSFSVIVPTYNRAGLIEKTLHSLFAQTYRDFEIIVADDGSTDNTAQILESYGGRIRFYRQPNSGAGAARNLGVKHSTGEYLAFLDSDDLWFPWTLETYARIIKEQNRPTLIAGTLRYFYDESELSGLTAEPVAHEAFPDYYAASRRGHYCGTCQMVVRRDAFLGIGGFAEETTINNEDHDLVMRLGTAPGYVHLSAPAMIGYRQHAGAISWNTLKTFTGSMREVQMERTGRFPGGRERRRDRLRIVTQHLRPVTLALLRQKEYRKAWALYRQTFAWNLRLGRVRFLAAFFVKAALSGIK